MQHELIVKKVDRIAALQPTSSRAVLYTLSGDDFAQAARRVALQTRDTLEAAKA